MFVAWGIWARFAAVSTCQINGCRRASLCKGSSDRVSPAVYVPCSIPGTVNLFAFVGVGESNTGSQGL